MGVQYKESTSTSFVPQITKDYVDNAKKEYTLQMRLWTAKQIKGTTNGASASPAEVLRGLYAALQQQNAKPSNSKACTVNTS